MERASRIRIRHSHRTLEQRQEEFCNAVEKVKNSDFTPQQQAHRIDNLRKAHLGERLARSEAIFTADCTKSH